MGDIHVGHSMIKPTSEYNEVLPNCDEHDEDTKNPPIGIISA